MGPNFDLSLALTCDNRNQIEVTMIESHAGDANIVKRSTIKIL